MLNGKNIWIIGASEGIGKELAIQLDLLNANVIISARNKLKLDSIINQMQGNKNLALTLDAKNFDDLNKSAEEILKIYGRLDIMIFMAGVYKPGSFFEQTIEDINDIIDINFKAAAYSVKAVLSIFAKQGFGQIALCGSVAGYRGLPNSQPYGATKAAIINLAESLKLELDDKNIDVKVINPGFVKTRLTDMNKFEMPAIISAQKAAAFIIKGLDTKKFEIHFPKAFTCSMKLLRILPQLIFFKLAKKLV